MIPRRLQSFILAIATILTELCQVSHALTNGVDVYEGIENCNAKLAGPNCDIPYEPCADGKTKCFNNSKCTKDSKSFQNTYHCDCTHADEKTNSVTRFAGLECEHSSTTSCKDVKDGFGSQFCTNGGQCMSYVLGGVTRSGCACPSEYIGAYCQYLASSVKGGIAGESILEDVHENFWTIIPKKTTKTNNNGMGVAIGISVSAIVVILLTISVALVKRKKKINEKKISMDPSSIEADGSSTLNNRPEVL